MAILFKTGVVLEKDVLHKKVLDKFINMWENIKDVGVWRSLVARLNGVQEVASSNLVTPIFIYRDGAYFNLLRKLLKNY